MGNSTVQQLINRARSFNAYNNSGIESDISWHDFMNEALQSMADVLQLQETHEIQHTQNTIDYDLPADYYAIETLLNSDYEEVPASNDSRISVSEGKKYDFGYRLKNKGLSYGIELINLPDDTYKLHYFRYPKVLLLSEISTQKPEVPTISETALCYKTAHFACLNNNEVNQAQYFEERFQRELITIRRAAARSRGV